MMDEDDFESVLFVARDVYVYRIPPRSSSEGYRAANWGDMYAPYRSQGHLSAADAPLLPPRSSDACYRGQPLWRGRLRVIEKGSGTPSKCFVRLEDGNSGELFALTPYTPSKNNTNGGVEAVLDSSRYFVLTVLDQESGARAYLGMGFPERTESFDFNVALQDWSKRQTVKPTLPDAPAGPSPHLPASGSRDFSLKPGESFSIKLGGASTKKKADPSAGGDLLGEGGGNAGKPAAFLLPPPPSAPRR